MNHLLFTWNRPTEHVFVALDKVVLYVDFGKLKLKQNTFTLWNLLEFREKLCLSRDILEYLRTMNGFGSIKNEAIESIIKLLLFVKKN